MYFLYFVIISPWKRGRALHFNKLKSSSPKDAFCQVRLKLAQWFWRRRYFNFVNGFLLFCNYLPMELGWGPSFKSSSSKNALCWVWLKLARWFWRWRFFNIIDRFLLYRYYLPLEKGGALHLNKLESSSPKDALCQVWLKLAQGFWRRRWKCEKFTTTPTTTMTTTDNRQILIRKAPLSLRIRWAKKKKSLDYFRAFHCLA